MTEYCLFFCYSPSKHFHAHLYEHLLSISAEKNGFSSHKTTAHSGILKIPLTNNQKKPVDLNKIINLSLIDSKDLQKEAQRVYMEVAAGLDMPEKLFLNLTQYQANSRQEFEAKLNNEYKNLPQLEALKKSAMFITNVSVKETGVIPASKIKECFSLRKEGALILPHEIKLPKAGKLTFLQIATRVPINNWLEMYKLIALESLLMNQLKQEIIREGLAYSVKPLVYQDYTKHLFLSLQLRTMPKLAAEAIEKTKNLISKPRINENGDKETLSRIVDGFIRKIEKKSSTFQEKINRVWQQLTWGNFIPIKTQVKALQALRVDELRDWWTEKILQSTFHILKSA